MTEGLVYNIQRMSVDDGPGLRTTVFLKGCPLRCRWCSNPESQSFAPQLMIFAQLCLSCRACLAACPHGAVGLSEGGGLSHDREKCRDCGMCAQACPNGARAMSGQRLSVGEVMKAVGQDELFYRNSEGGVTFGGGEPTAGGDFLLGLMESSQARGYHVCLDTCGLAPEPFFRQALALSDLLLFDLKHMDPDAHLELTGAGNQAILSNLGLALSSKAEVRIRMPLMPGLNDSEENIGAMADFLRPLGKDEVEVMPNHAFGRGKYLALNLPPPDIPAYRPEELKEALGRFKKLGLKTAIV